MERSCPTLLSSKHFNFCFPLVSNTPDHLGFTAQASKRRKNHDIVLAMLTETAANIDRRFTATDPLCHPFSMSITCEIFQSTMLLAA